MANFTARLKSLDLAGTAGFDWIKLEYCNRSVRRRKPILTPNFSARIEAGMGGACTAAYIVSLEGARFLREVQTPISATADGAMGLAHKQSFAKAMPLTHLRKSRPFYTVPRLAFQDGGAFTGSEKRLLDKMARALSALD